MPPVTPSTWKNTRLTDRFAPVCPQLPPVPASGPEALLEVPRERLAQLRRLLPLLTNQSEDCLYLNLYVPRVGKCNQQKITSIIFITFSIYFSYYYCFIVICNGNAKKIYIRQTAHIIINMKRCHSLYMRFYVCENENVVITI